MYQDNDTDTQAPELERAKVSLKSVYAIITCTVIILLYLTAIKNSVTDVGHNVDLIKQANDNDRNVNAIKMDIMQKQIDGNSQQIKTQQDEIEQLKLNEQKK